VAELLELAQAAGLQGEREVRLTLQGQVPLGAVESEAAVVAGEQLACAEVPQVHAGVDRVRRVLVSDRHGHACVEHRRVEDLDPVGDGDRGGVQQQRYFLLPPATRRDCAPPTPCRTRPTWWA
jgi:hypothetical protein